MKLFLAVILGMFAIAFEVSLFFGILDFLLCLIFIPTTAAVIAGLVICAFNILILYAFATAPKH